MARDRVSASLAALFLLLAAAGAGAAGGLQAVADDYRELQDLPGLSVAVVAGGREVFAGGSGFADLETGRPMTAETLLYAGSLSKIFTAVLTLNLVADGQLRLEDKVPGIAGGRQGVTVIDLMTHSSGLVREGDFGYWFTGDFPDENGLSRFLGATNLRGTPGTAVSYSNIGYAALGLHVSRVTGSSFNELLRERVIAPLGLSMTGGPGPAAGIAPGYTPPGQIVPSAERPFAGVGRRVGSRHVREYHDARAMTPAFGLYSTARDLGRLASFLLGYGDSGVLPDRLRVRMLRPANARRTLGLSVGALDGRDVLRHSGWFAAHRSHLLIDLRAEAGVIVLANADNADTGAIAEALLREALVAGAAPASR